MKPFFAYGKSAKARCVGCRFSKLVHATDGWSFYGCYHEPYHGKWVAEIKACPLLPESEAKK